MAFSNILSVKRNQHTFTFKGKTRKYETRGKFGFDNYNDVKQTIHVKSCKSSQSMIFVTIFFL